MGRVLKGIPARDLKALIDDARSSSSGRDLVHLGRRREQASIVVGVTEDKSPPTMPTLVRAGAEALGSRGGGSRPVWPGRWPGQGRTRTPRWPRSRRSYGPRAEPARRQVARMQRKRNPGLLYRPDSRITRWRCIRATVVRSMRVLVLGGYGLIGEAVVRRLAADDHHGRRRFMPTTTRPHGGACRTCSGTRPTSPG